MRVERVYSSVKTKQKSSDFQQDEYNLDNNAWIHRITGAKLSKLPTV